MHETALIATGLLGLVAHWYKRKRLEQTSSSLWKYLITYPDRSFYSIVAMGSAVMAISGELGTQTLMQAFTIGYTLDSVLNKDPGANGAKASVRSVRSVGS